MSIIATTSSSNMRALMPGDSKRRNFPYQAIPITS